MTGAQMMVSIPEPILTHGGKDEEESWRPQLGHFWAIEPMQFVLFFQIFHYMKKKYPYVFKSP